MPRFLRTVICLLCISFVSQAYAQDGYFDRLTMRFLTTFFSAEDQTENSDLPPIRMAENFKTETIFCSDTPPTEFDIIPLDERYPDSEWVTHLRRVRTDQGILYVAFRDFEDPGVTDEVVQHVICEDSPAGQALKAVLTNEITCGMASPTAMWIEGHWTNRAGDQKLIRIVSIHSTDTMFIYLKKEGDIWVFDDGWCGYDDPPSQALRLITDYMYNHEDSFYFLGSVDIPVFAEITIVRGDLDQMTVVIELETQNDRKAEQDDPVCMFSLRGSHDLVMIIYEMRCTLNT